MNVVRESRAGDDFHLLWAARRALALVDPRSSLKVVRMEGLAPADADENDDQFLGVDVTEYHNGETVAEASLVVVTQLKYSVRHPREKWTTARLATPVRGGGASVIRRLAAVFEGLVEQGGDDRGGVIAKLCIRLVSNQPAAKELVTVVDHAKEVLSGLPVGTRMSDVAKGLTPKERRSVTRLQERSGLSSTLFADFLRVLDVSGCGEEPRYFQRLRLTQDVGRMTAGPHVPAVVALLDIVRQETLPEAASSPGLRRAEVVAALGASSEHDLLPAPTLFEALSAPVATSEPATLASVLLGAPMRAVLAYGMAGIGKTTTVLSLEAALPPGSVVVPYDCFGGGDYLSPGEDRHTARRALVQLANELMLRLGTTPLLPSVLATEADLWRHFRLRLEEAAGLLDEGAVLVIAVDAADNAVYGAERQGNAAFVQSMWELRKPDNARLVMTCRKHRRDVVRPRAPVVEHELSGFDVDASTAMLQRTFVLASSSDGSVFHDRTRGVPRVQAYLLASHEAGELESLLARSRKGLEEIFDDVIRAALEERPTADRARREIATLFALTRPVRLTGLAAVLGVDVPTARDVAAALQPGLVVDADTVRFPDEDFEHHLRDHLAPDEIRDAHSRIADDFLGRCAVDGEAAAALAEHLKAAGRDDELVALTLREPVPMAIDDGLARVLVGRRRLKLALSAASSALRPEDGLRLLFLAARAARSDTSLTTIIRERPELAARFADGEAVSTVYMRADNKPWLGPAHFRAAAVLAWDPEARDAAIEQLERADAWIRQWALRDEDDRRGWNITADDLANGAAALYALHGPEAAVGFLGRWRPRAVIDAAVPRLAQLVAAHVGAPAMARDLARLGASAWIQAQFIVAMEAAGRAVSRAWIRRVGRRLASIPVEHPILSDRPEWGVAFCEAAARARVPKAVAAALITRLRPRFPSFPPGDYDRLWDWIEPLRAACLSTAIEGRELRSEDLLPESLRPSADRRPGEYDPEAGKRRSFKEALDPLLVVCGARAKGLVAGISVEDVAHALAPALAQFRQQAGSRWFRSRHRYQEWAVEAAHALIGASGDATANLREVLATADLVLPRTASLRVRIAGSLMPHESYRPLALELLGQAEEEVGAKPYAAGDRRDILLDAAATAADADSMLAADLVARAVDAAHGIDDEVGQSLGVIARMLARVARTVTRERARALGERLARATEAVTPYVSDPAEVLPHRQVIATVADLDPSSAFALASRWDDEDRLDLARSVPVLVRHVCASGALEPEVGLWLLRIVDDDDACVHTGVELLDLLASAGPGARPLLVGCFSVLAEWTGRDVRLHERARLARELTTWADANGLGAHAAAARLRALTTFVDSLAEPVETGSAPRRVWEGASVPDAATAPPYRATMDVELQRLVDDYASETTVVDYLLRVVAAAGPHRRVVAIRELVEVAGNHSDRPSLVRAVAAALRAAVDRWQSSVRVREWAADALPRFVELHLPLLFGIGSGPYAGWAPVLELPYELTAERVPMLMRATAARLDELDVGQLHAVIEACVRVAAPADTAPTVEWALDLVAPQEPPPQPPDLPTTVPRVVASFLWCALGHPDERVRWRAAHTCRGLLSTGGGAPFLDGLVDQLDATAPGAFRAADLDFFWLSARMWTLLVLARVAADRPALLTRHAIRLAAVATDRTLPHAACREFAKRAVLRLERHVPGSIPAETLGALLLTNVPLSCRSVRGHRLERTGNPRGERLTRFRFDSTDTLPYWYQPLAGVFGSDTDDVAVGADRWITDVWGRTHDECNSDPRRDRSGHEWANVRNDHGTRPLVETLRTYLEYHAMLLVAGELVDAGEAVLVEPYDDAGDPWRHWLRRHLTTDLDCWRADRRSPTPLEPEYFGKVPDRSAFEKRPETFDRLIGLNGENGDDLVVASLARTDDHDHHVTLRVASALVSPDTAGALLRALEATPPRAFDLPLADEGCDAWGNEINEPGFQLLGWLHRFETSWSELDDHDPLAASGGDHRTVPADDFLTFNRLSADSTGCRFRSADGDTVVLAEAWGDHAGPGERHEVRIASDGRRTRVRRDALLRYLKHRGLDLIIEANVWIYRRERAGPEEDEYGYERSRIYLLRRDGSLEVLGGRHGPRAADRFGTRSRRGQG